ncbi:protein mono-ADP-ribosyltransferase PARP14 [Megalops cyprinoides]|uniref:protein mono-ADP-ribosyltransferase PARP14 n=1 Tax=Megalops cyprinoides TaxID=118141 RepID=UPI001863C7AB|nr:protein mono-ADP-ribosyltransferase PARP14 [Megalops cyprinoides]
MAEKTLILDGLPDDLASVKSKLDLHFKNKRKSGGEILEIRDYPGDKRKALLVYLEDEALKKVLEKKIHKVDFKALGIQDLKVKLPEEDDGPNVKGIKETPLLRPRLEEETLTGKSTHVEEKHPVVFCQKDSQRDKNDDKAHSLIVYSVCPITEEILRLYFEQFSDDVDISILGNNRWVLNLANQSDVEKVLAKKDHTLEDSPISVELYDREAESRFDPHRFILSGFSEDCKCSLLSVYIKSCSKGAEHSWEVLDDGERIAVTFKQDIDVNAFLKKCSSKKLQNMEITACRLEYTDSVLVEGNMSNISEETLSLYFSNKRSNGGAIKSIIWVNKAKSVIITFQDCHVALRVAKQKHSLCRVSLCTLLFYSSLQQALTGETPTLPNFPSEMIIPVDAFLLDYIKLNEACKRDFDRILQEVYASISLEEPHQVTLQMTVDRESLLLHRLAHTWKRNARQAIETLLEKYSVIMLMSTEEVWERIKSRCLSLSSSNASVSYESSKHRIVIVGQQSDAKRISDEIQALVKKGKEELEVEMNTIERKIPLDSREELDFLWNLVSAKLKDVKASKDEANLTFHLKGLRDNVSKGEGIVQEAQKGIATQTLNLSAQLTEFLKSLDLKKFERDHFIHNHISAVILSRGDSFQLLAENHDSQKARNKIKEVVKEEVINLTPDQVKVTKDEQWRVFFNGLKEEVESCSNVQNVSILVSDVQITVCGFCNVVADVSRKLKGYLNNKMPVTEDVPLKTLKEVEYIDACMRLSEAPEIKALDVTILSSKTQVSPCLKVTAASDKIKEAVAAVKKQIAVIVTEKHTYSKAGESKVLQKHQAALKARAKEFDCKLYLTIEPAKQINPGQSYSYKIADCLTLTVALGNLSQHTAAALVCPLSSNLSFDNPIAQQVLQVGGPQIKDVCDNLLKESQTLVAGDVIMANPGKLSSKALLFAAIPTWGTSSHSVNGQALESIYLESATLNSLQSAEDIHCVSVAMPALGCGTFGFPTRDSCKAILKGVTEFSSCHQQTPTNVKEVFVVDADVKTVEEFHAVLKDMGYLGAAVTNTTSSVDSAKKTQQVSPPPLLPKPGANLKVMLGGVTVLLKQGDITKVAVDAIVNSTNTTLNLGTGVSGAILKAAGQSVVDECTKLGTQKADGVVVTGGGNLKCKHIIQMVGPNKTADITASIEKVLKLCESKMIATMSIPAIGTGRGNIKPEQSIEAVLKGLENHLSQTTSSCIKTIFIVAFDQKVFDSFCDYFAERNQQPRQSKQASTGPPSANVQSGSTQLPDNQVKIHDVRIEVKKGNITMETVRGIVNTTNKELNLKGGVSGAIFRAAGQSVEEGCKMFGPQGVDGVVVTKGGALQCDFIIHMVGPHSTAAVTSQVERVLEQCEKNQITTVSFPAVGTGGGGLNAVDVITAMLQGFDNHLSQRNSTVLKLIYIVIDQDKVLQQFLQGLKQWTKREDSGDEADDEDEDVGEGEFTGNIEIFIGPIKVRAVCGNITEERTDAIVNSTNTSLDLNSGVSGAILKAAGQTVVDECKALGTQPSNGVVTTKAGNLHAKHIVHMVGQTKEKEITNSMYDVLVACNNIKAQSVSFPALGTGAGNVAASQVANAMIYAIGTFLLDNQNPSVTTINIVIFQPKMMSDFEQVMKKFKKVTPKPGLAAAAKTQTKLPSTFSNPSQSQTISNTPTPSHASAAAGVTLPITVAEVYGSSPASLAQVKRCLDELISEECTSEDVVSEYLRLLKDPEKQDIAAASQRHQVHIQILADKVTVSGKKDDVLSAVLQIKDSLQKVQERQNREREEKRIWETVRWKAERLDQWTDLDQNFNHDLELAFHRKDKCYTYQHRGEIFTMDLKNMLRTDSRGRTTKIKRTLLTDSDTAIIQPPPAWTKMGDKEMDIILLSPKSQEFLKISKEFVLSCQVFVQENNKNIEVIQIQRIQHQEQWQRYAVRKQAVDKKYPKNKNEQFLYHGTTKDICQKINKNGFNRSFCGRNATKYGSGTYFAKEAYYSCHDAYSNPDENGHKYIYRARVLTGMPCLGQHGMKEPAPINPSDHQAGLHDCTVDNLQNPFIFVIFCDSGAYPDYLITFKTV